MTHWYEAVFVLGVAILALALGWCICKIQMQRHLIDGFRYLAEVSQDRVVGGSDIYTAFGWPARQRRHLAMSNRIERERTRNGRPPA